MKITNGKLENSIINLEFESKEESEIIYDMLKSINKILICKLDRNSDIFISKLKDRNIAMFKFKFCKDMCLQLEQQNNHFTKW